MSTTASSVSGWHRRGVRRPPAALIVVATAVLAGSAWKARRRRVDPCEERVFRTVNDAPDRIAAPTWLLMQAGTLGAVGVATWMTRREPDLLWRRVLVAGTSTWVGGKIVKPLVGRGRPEELLDGVHRRGAVQSGLGFPSGHAAVATTLALVAAPPTRWGRTLGSAMALGTGLARIYVGAHLPLDVVGGYAIGSMIGSAAVRNDGTT